MLVNISLQSALDIITDKMERLEREIDAERDKNLLQQNQILSLIKKVTYIESLIEENNDEN